MVPGTRRIVEEGGEVYIEIQVNHSGVVQLADRQATTAAADIGIFVGLAAILGLQRTRGWRRD